MLTKEMDSNLRGFTEDQLIRLELNVPSQYLSKHSKAMKAPFAQYDSMTRGST